MKLNEHNQELAINIKGFNFEETLNKTVDELKKGYYDNPDAFVNLFLLNSQKLQELGDKNNWVSSEEVAKEVDDQIRAKKLTAVSQKELAVKVIEVISKVKEEKKTSERKTKTKPKKLVCKIQEGMFGTDVEFGNILIPKEEFIEKMKDEFKGLKYEFDWQENKVTVEETKKEIDSEDEEDEECDDCE